jgi:hypothetical protein
MTSPSSESEEFTDDDARELARLLAKFGTTDLDQFQHLIVQTKWGPVYIVISIERMRDGCSASIYQTIWPLPPHLDPSRSADQDTAWVMWRQQWGSELVEQGRFADRRAAEQALLKAEDQGEDASWISAVSVDRESGG